MYKNYEIIKTEELEDISSEGILLRHIKTGARVAVIKNEDNNKVFSIAFRTPVDDSTGVPHIIEHTVLCGSDKFPIKDPFIELAKGSLNTFLNAMTFPDKTMYPVASTNDKDFQNLMDVYLDAVFHPNIYKREEIFKQEGWHYELEKNEDGGYGDLTINGVVYNEMKGAFSSPEGMLEEDIFHALYPDTGYGYVSGGDPDVIPELTYDNYLDFHRRYYHPSNSYIYLYGDMNVEEKLSFIDEEYLSKYEAQPIDSTIRLQEKFAEVRRERFEYPIATTDSEENNTYLSYNVALADGTDLEKNIAMDIIDYCMFGMSGAPVKQALIDAEIGDDIISGFDTSVRQPFFSIAAKHANEGDQDRFLQIIRTELEKQVKNGINKKSILAGINSNEFSYREADFGGYPKGLIYCMNCMTTWLHDDEKVFDLVKIGDIFDRLREKLEKEEGYFEKLVQECLLDNKHAVLVVLAPKKGLTAEKDEALKTKLEEYKKTLSTEEKEKLVQQTISLKEYQSTPDSPEDLLCLPMLERADMKKEARPLHNEEKNIGNAKAIYHDIATNGIAYVSVQYPLNVLTEDELLYFGLMKKVIGDMNTRSYTYAELTNEIDLSLGGFSTPADCYVNVDDDSQVDYRFMINFKALVGNVRRGVELAEEVINSTKFDDVKRLKELIQEIVSKQQMKFTTSGHTSAVLRTSSYFYPESRFKDLINGYDMYNFLKNLMADYDNMVESVIEKMKAVAAKIFSQVPIVSLTVDKKNADEVLEQIGELITLVSDNYKDSVEAKDNLILNFEQKNEGFKNAAQIQYVARSGNFKKHGFKYHGSMSVLKVIMNYEYLWQNIRVLGGAYGCMSGFSRGGNTYFVSYRDPKLLETNEVFEGIADYLESFDCDDRDMTKYLIGAMGAVDSPLTPAQAGDRDMNAYMSGITYETIQASRDEMLAVSQQDIRNLAPLVRAVMSDGNICVIGNEEKIEEAKSLFKNVRELL